MIKVWSNVLIKGKQEGHGGAIRLFAIAKHIDKAGSSLILENELRSFCLDAGVKTRTYQRWFNDAVSEGYFRYTHDDRYYMLGWVKISKLLGVEKIDSRPAMLDIAQLISPGWFAFVYAGWLAGHQGKPISRKTRRTLTGIPESTQQVLEKKSGIVNTRNYLETGVNNELVDGLVEEGHWSNGYKGKNGAMRRLPNTSTTGITRGLRGRTKKMQRELNYSLNRGQVSDKNPMRLFHANHGQAKQTIKNINKYDLPGIRELFVRKTKTTWGVH